MKHCTTDKCPQILDSSCVFYEGASLIFSGVNTNDSVETVIQKLNLKLESIPRINLGNYYTKSETFSQNQINTYLSTKLDKGEYTGTAQSLKNEIDSKANISHTHYISNINGLQTVLDSKLNKGNYQGTAGDLKTLIDSVSQNLQNETSSRVNADLLKQDKLSSYDESIIIENGGNIEGNVSLFEEYFEQQNCVLNFTPIQIIGVYVNGIKQRPSSYVITLPKTITITNFTSGDYIEIQYTKLKI